jgi:hypothetical protein
MQRGLLEVVGQQPETRDIRGPAPTGRRKRQQGHFNDVAGGSAFDEHGSGHRIGLGEVQTVYIIDRR